MKRMSIFLAVLISCAFLAQAHAQPRSQNVEPLSAGSATVGDPKVDFLIALARRESGGRKTAVNRFGYIGLFQMGGAALVDAGFYKVGASQRANAWDGQFLPRAEFLEVTDRQHFLASVGAQEIAVRAYHDKVWTRLRRMGVDRRLGETVGGVLLTQSGVIAGAHLVGPGAVLRFVNSNGLDIVQDGNGTSLVEYLRIFGGFF